MSNLASYKFEYLIISLIISNWPFAPIICLLSVWLSWIQHLVWNFYLIRIDVTYWDWNVHGICKKYTNGLAILWRWNWTQLEILIIVSCSNYQYCLISQCICNNQSITIKCLLKVWLSFWQILGKVIHAKVISIIN